MADERSKVLERTLMDIERRFGKGAIMRLGEAPRLEVEVIPTGILPLDIALGVGGLPRGRIVEVFGEEGSGKTTVALHAIASAQKAGGNAVFIDAEHALDPRYAESLGVDIKNLLISQPDYGEQALDIAAYLIQSAAVDIVVIDSVAALLPRSELDGSIGDQQVGLQARLMSQAMRKLAGLVARSKAVVIFINQLREKIAAGGFQGGPLVTTPGGRALKFYASVRIEARQGEKLKSGTSVFGHELILRVVKNKVAPPFRTCKVDMIYGQGVSIEGAIIDMALEAGIIEKRGTWFVWGEERLGQGKENTRTYLKENPQVLEALSKALQEKLGALASTKTFQAEGEEGPGEGLS
ncbi:MAG: recombinase RecA [Thermanaeromonas sp.]|uniref:recombinase RecA n=1 Tax=Thermanaeromonas sp. TaxID=2003697 RepID=UPI00243A00CA|nr:recombinase RecA [Thermanaeromonas sp.]MCG0278591.1 recombinase RecA [Thermanaeromonas sp.]